MPLRETYNARRYNELITLTYSEPIVDDYGHKAMTEPIDVLDVYASVRQMSASKTMLTFQQADVIGLDIEFRKPEARFNGLRYKGHDVVFSQPEAMERGRILRLSGYYQIDNP